MDDYQQKVKSKKPINNICPEFSEDNEKDITTPQNIYIFQYIMLSK